MGLKYSLSKRQHRVHIFALGIARNVIEERKEAAGSNFDVKLYRVLEERLSNETAQGEVYVSSFTEMPDQLSQWRAYCPPSGGYAIGFKSKFIVAAESAAEQFLAHSIYDTYGQSELIKKLIDVVLQFADGCVRDRMPHDRIFRESFKLLGRYYR